MFRFASGLSGYFGLVRASPFYWRVHVFGDEGSVEAVGETETIVRTRGGKVARREFPKVDSILAEFDAFADAVTGRAPYPITPAEMINTISAFEAIIQSMNTRMPVSID
jgi:predicted dehydrogenase